VAGRAGQPPTYKGRENVTEINRNTVLVNTVFYIGQNFS